VKRTTQPINLLDLRPKHNLAWEEKEGGLVVLLVPKFRNRYIVKWFVPMLARPNIRVKLDAFGSYLWQRCDGKTTVGEMGQAMAKEFDESLDSMYERIANFIQRLVRDRFLLLDSSSAKQ
jgi:hypothetical protein